MNKAGSYIEPEDQPPVFYYNYRDYPKVPQPRTGCLQLSQSVEEEPEDITINTHDSNDLPTDKNVIDVYLRLKPNGRGSNPTNENVLEIQNTNSVVFKSTKDMKCSFADSCNVYRFSKIYGPHIVQQEIFQNIVHNMLERYLNGEDALLFSFGTTNSGKTFTIQGTVDKPGIIPRTLNILFNSLAPYLDRSEHMFRPTYASNVTMLSTDDRKQCLDIKKQILTSFDEGSSGSTFSTTTSSYKTADDTMFKTLDKEHSVLSLTHFSGYDMSVWISFYEVYNENVYDLLDVTSSKLPKKKPALKIGRDQNQDVYIKDLTYVNVYSCEEAYKVLCFGKSHLSVASTELNNKSSRSHCVFSIKLVKVDPVSEQLITMSSFDICDLAGAERQKRAQTTGERLREARTINSSLHVLARCFQVLRENSSQPKDKKKLVPYRDSKLTQIFQRSLQGSNPVKMIVNVNTSPAYAEETLQVLKISAVARDLITIARPPRPAAHSRRKTRFSVMASRNLDWHQESELFASNEELTNYFQGRMEEDPYETIRALECKLAEFEGFNKREFEEKLRAEMHTAIEDLSKIINEMQEDWNNDVKNIKARHREELEKQRLYYKSQADNLRSWIKQLQADAEEDNDETLDESAIESQKSTIRHLKQELNDLEIKYRQLGEEHDNTTNDLSKKNEELVAKNKELEAKVKDLNSRVAEMQKERRMSDNGGRSEDVRYLKSLLDEAKEDFKDQSAEIEELRCESDKLREENRLMRVKNAELEDQLEQRDYLIVVKTDSAEELQEKLDYMESKFQTESIEFERLMSEKEALISQLRSQLESNRTDSHQSACDEQALQKEIKNLGSLLVEKDGTISELKTKLHKYEGYIIRLKEDRKTKENHINELKSKCEVLAQKVAKLETDSNSDRSSIKDSNTNELKSKCEELSQKVAKLETDCSGYLKTIKNMEDYERSTKENNQTLLKIYEDRLNSVQDELSQVKTRAMTPTPVGLEQLQAKVKSLNQELVQKSNTVRDLQLNLLQKGETINMLKQQIEKVQRSPLKGLENQMTKINLESPDPGNNSDDDPDFLPSRCKSTSKKKQIKKPFSHNKTSAGDENRQVTRTPGGPIATPRRKLFNQSELSDNSDVLKTPQDVPPVETVIPSPKSQIKNKLRGRRKANTSAK